MHRQSALLAAVSAFPALFQLLQAATHSDDSAAVPGDPTARQTAAAEVPLQQGSEAAAAAEVPTERRSRAAADAEEALLRAACGILAGRRLLALHHGAWVKTCLTRLAALLRAVRELPAGEGLAHSLKICC